MVKKDVHILAVINNLSSSVASQTVSSANVNLSVLPPLDKLHPGTVSQATTRTSAMSKDSTTHGELVWSDIIDTWQLPPPPPLSHTHRCCTPTPAGRSVVDRVTRVATRWAPWDAWKMNNNRLVTALFQTRLHKCRTVCLPHWLHIHHC